RRWRSPDTPYPGRPPHGAWDRCSGRPLPAPRSGPVRHAGPRQLADAGYGVSTPFRLGLHERGLTYVLALTGKESRPPGACRAAPAC
ncbi:transposase, partial [Streptomyces sp. DH12]|uniref:transposase n=1 Tax=Streptomyces sp. DH12 TaxID=2857010 RepID=UPI001E41D629